MRRHALFTRISIFLFWSCHLIMWWTVHVVFSEFTIVFFLFFSFLFLFFSLSFYFFIFLYFPIKTHTSCNACCGGIWFKGYTLFFFFFFNPLCLVEKKTYLFQRVSWLVSWLESKFFLLLFTSETKPLKEVGLGFCTRSVHSTLHPVDMVETLPEVHR